MSHRFIIFTFQNRLPRRSMASCKNSLGMSTARAVRDYPTISSVIWIFEDKQIPTWAQESENCQLLGSKILIANQLMGLTQPVTFSTWTGSLQARTRLGYENREILQCKGTRLLPWLHDEGEPRRECRVVFDLHWMIVMVRTSNCRLGAASKQATKISVHFWGQKSSIPTIQY